MSIIAPNHDHSSTEPSFSSRITSILKQGVTPSLKSRGFRKRGNVFTLEGDEVSYLIDVQRFWFNTAEECKFTLNAGVYVPGFWPAFGCRPDPARPKVPDCCINVRVGMLSEPRLSESWILFAGDDVASKDAQTAAEIQTRVEGDLLPFLERFKTVLDVAVFLEQPRAREFRSVYPVGREMSTEYAGILHWLLGDSEKCYTLLTETIEITRVESARENTINLRERLCGKRDE